MVTCIERYSDQRVDLVGAETDESKGERVIARCRDQYVFRLVPPMQDPDEPEATIGSGAGERCGLASVFMTRFYSGGPRVGLVPVIEHKENKKGIEKSHIRWSPAYGNGYPSDNAQESY